MAWLESEPATSRSRVRHANHSVSTPTHGNLQCRTGVGGELQSTRAPRAVYPTGCLQQNNAGRPGKTAPRTQQLPPSSAPNVQDYWPDQSAPHRCPGQSLPHTKMRRWSSSTPTSEHAKNDRIIKVVSEILTSNPIKFLNGSF
ncbi:hypothetical protein ElyMa_005482300 [Elysia marginata]|uniref:Uncharacterized protein n=1 Tax=Elysia marginata TaxID=1093978 RepID=A0AAV4EQR3_9GAST|nr:hypothetical protein ElyMa_005482300 [Elysia marginata]